MRVTAGEIYDVAVDLRKSSPAFGQWFGLNLSADTRQQLWVPPGFAHGFYVLSEWAEVQYKASDYYAPQWERSLLWNDPKIGIGWPLIDKNAPIVAAKDAAGAALDQAEVFD